MSLALLGILNSQAAGGGGIEDYGLIASVDLASQTSVLIENLPTDYKHLVIRYKARTFESNWRDFMKIKQINGTNFIDAGVYQQVGFNSDYEYGNDNGVIGFTGATKTDSDFNIGEFILNDYQSTTYTKGGTSFTANHVDNPNNAFSMTRHDFRFGQKNYTTPISSIEIGSSSGDAFYGNSYVELYGLLDSGV